MLTLFRCKDCSSVPTPGTFLHSFYAAQKKQFPLKKLEVSQPLARPPGAGRLEVEAFGWAWDRILRRKCLGPARAWPRPWPKGQDRISSSSIFGPKPNQILQLPASQPLEAALAAD